MKITFFKAGKWADKPWMPQIKVTAGEVVDVSPDLADVVLKCGAGELYEAEPEPTDETAESIPVIETEPTDPETLEISEIGLSNAILSKLALNDVKSVSELIQKSEQDILSMDGIGQAKADDIAAALDKYGLNLKEDN